MEPESAPESVPSHSWTAAARTIDLPAPPTSSTPPEPQHGPAVVAAVLAARRARRSPLLAGDPRYLLVCAVMAAGSVGLSLLVRRRAVRAHRHGRRARPRGLPARGRRGSARRGCRSMAPASARSKPRTRERRPMSWRAARPGSDETSPRMRRQSPGRPASGSAPAPVRPRPRSGSRRRRRRTTRAPTLPSRQALAAVAAARVVHRAPVTARPAGGRLVVVRGAASTTLDVVRAWVGGAGRDPRAGRTGAGRRRRPSPRAARGRRRLGVGALAPAHRWAMARARSPPAPSSVRTGDLALLLPQLLQPAGSPGPGRRTGGGGRGGRRAARPDSGPVTRHDRAGGRAGRRAPAGRRRWSCTSTSTAPAASTGATARWNCRTCSPDRMSAADADRFARALAPLQPAGVAAGRRTDPVRLAPLLAAVDGQPAAPACRSVSRPTARVVHARPAGERRGRQRAARRPRRGDRVRQVRAAAVARARARRHAPAPRRSLWSSWTTRAAPPSTRCGALPHVAGLVTNLADDDGRDRPAAGRARRRAGPSPAGAASTPGHDSVRRLRARPSRGGTDGRQRARARPARGRRRVRRAARGPPRAARHLRADRSARSFAGRAPAAGLAAARRGPAARAGRPPGLPDRAAHVHRRASPRLCSGAPAGRAAAGAARVRLAAHRGGPATRSAPRRRRRRTARPAPTATSGTRCDERRDVVRSSRRGARRAVTPTRPRPSRPPPAAAGARTTGSTALAELVATVTATRRVPLDRCACRRCPASSGWPTCCGTHAVPACRSACSTCRRSDGDHVPRRRPARRRPRRRRRCAPIRPDRAAAHTRRAPRVQVRPELPAPGRHRARLRARRPRRAAAHRGRRRRHRHRRRGAPAHRARGERGRAAAQRAVPTTARATRTSCCSSTTLVGCDGSSPTPRTALVALATAGRRARLHLAVTAARWTDLRPALLDGVGDAAGAAAGRRGRLALPARRHSRRCRTARVRRCRPTVRRCGSRSPTGPNPCAPARPAAGHRACVRCPAAVHEDEVAPTAATPRARSRSASLARAVAARAGSRCSIRGAHLLVSATAAAGGPPCSRRVVHWYLAGVHGRHQVHVHVLDPRRTSADVAALPARGRLRRQHGDGRRRSSSSGGRSTVHDRSAAADPASRRHVAASSTTPSSSRAATCWSPAAPSPLDALAALRAVGGGPGPARRPRPSGRRARRGRRTTRCSRACASRRPRRAGAVRRPQRGSGRARSDAPPRCPPGAAGSCAPTAVSRDGELVQCALPAGADP